jgi:hypothetical protein
MSLYNAKKVESTLRITKFDDDLDVESSYITSPSTCECPAGVRDSCRHRQMLPVFIGAKRIDKPWFLDFDTDEWWYFDAESAELMTEPPKPDTRKPSWRRL